jgi:endonuclease/exonuclease/phosphatase family metal-dependent hydrolase
VGSSVGTTAPPPTAVAVGRRAPAWTGRGWLVAISGLLTALLLDVLRVWLPSVVHVQGDAGSTPALQLGSFAAVWFLAPFPAAIAVRRLGPVRLLRASVVAAATARVALQWTDGGQPQLWWSSVALLAVAFALVALAAGTPSGHLTRVGVVLGLALSSVAHVALGTLDLVWRPEPWATACVVVLAGVTVLAAERARRVPLWWPSAVDQTGEIAPVWTRGAAWPWLGVGPAVALTGILVAVPARLDLAVGWTPTAAALAIAVAGGAAVAVAVASPSLGGPLTGSAGAALVVLCTLGALRPNGPLAVVSQLGLLVGIGLVLAAPGTTPGDSGPRRRGSAAAGSLLLFFVIGFAYYASYELAFGLPNRGFLVLAAVLLGTLGVAAGWAGRDIRRARQLPVRTLVATAVGTLVVGGSVVVAAQGTPATADVTSAGAGELRVAAFNVHSGYRTDGRFDPDGIAEVLLTNDVDVVVLNEVDRGWLLEGGHDLLRLLSDRLGMPHTVFSPAADEVWGNAVLSRRPLTSTRQEQLPRGDAAMSRALVSVLVDTGDGPLALVGTHLHHVPEEPRVRLVQARAVAAEVSRLRSRNLPVAVLGDLNATTDAPELEPLSFLDDAVPGDAPTWPADDPQFRLDHVLVSEDVRTSDATIPATTVSDHLPVIVTLGVGRAAE